MNTCLVCEKEYQDKHSCSKITQLIKVKNNFKPEAIYKIQHIED